MKKLDKYIYPAVFSFYDDGNIGITFPDLPGCVSSARSLNEALYMASDALGVHMAGIEDDNDPIPEPSSLLDVKKSLEDIQIAAPVSVLMPFYRKAEDSRPVNKMVTLPNWLVREARLHNVNFSQALRDALIEKLKG